jgi:hypothetical protein
MGYSEFVEVVDMRKAEDYGSQENDGAVRGLREEEEGYGSRSE